MVINRVWKKKLPEQLGLHCYAVSTHPDELVLDPPQKKSWSAYDYVYIWAVNSTIEQRCTGAGVSE